MRNTPIWLTESDVKSLIDLNGAINTLENLLKHEAEGSAENMPKTHLPVGNNNAIHALGGVLHNEGICGTKTWVNIDGKSATVLIIFSLDDGSCRAVIEATVLGQLRTAGITGVGTKLLAQDNIEEMAIIGSGKQALPQVGACASVRPIKRVRIFSRNPKNRLALAEQITQNLITVEPVVCETLERAVSDVPLITLCTNATEPFFFSKHATTGAHINAIGAITPNRVEFGTDIFPRCHTIAVDSLSGVKVLSKEFIDYFGDHDGPWERVRPLSLLVAENGLKKHSGDLTLFKAVGMGLSDLAIAANILRSSDEKKIGHKLPERHRVKLPL